MSANGDRRPEKKLTVISLGAGVVEEAGGGLDYSSIGRVVAEVQEIIRLGHEIVIVSSGAIAAGREICGELKGVSSDQRRLLHYSVGQPRLVQFYRELFLSRMINIGQMVVGRSAFSNRLHYISVRDTINGLLSNNIVPIVNDNDVLQDEIRERRENDHLSAYIAGMISADNLIFFTDQDGVFETFSDGSSRVLESVGDDASVLGHETVVANEKNKHILQKIAALRLVHELGIDANVCDGRDKTVIRAALFGQSAGTVIRSPKTKKLSGARKWLATGAMPKGIIILSVNGAEVMSRAEQRGSLLAKGIEGFNGAFNKGDVVSVCDNSGRLLGYGITRYGSEELPILVQQEHIIVIHANYFYGTNLEWYFGST